MPELFLSEKERVGIWYSFAIAYLRRLRRRNIDAFKTPKVRPHNRAIPKTSKDSTPVSIKAL